MNKLTLIQCKFTYFQVILMAKLLFFKDLYTLSRPWGKRYLKDYLDLSDHEKNLEPTEFTYTQDN